MTREDFMRNARHIGFGAAMAGIAAGAVILGYALTALVCFIVGQGTSDPLGLYRPLAGDAVIARAPALSPARSHFVSEAANTALHPRAAAAGLDFFGETSNDAEAGPGMDGITTSSGKAKIAAKRRGPRRLCPPTKNARSANCGRRMYPDESAKTSEARRMYQNTPQGAIKHGSARFRALAAWHDDIPFRDLRQRLNAAPRFPVIDGGRVDRGGTGMRRAHRPARLGGGGPDHAA